MTEPAKKTRKKAGANLRKPAEKRSAWRREEEDQQIAGRLGKRIHEHRESLGLSINAASELTGVPGATLSRIENNKMTPTFTTLIKLVSGLRLSWADLTSEMDIQPSPTREIDIQQADNVQFTDGTGYAYALLHPNSRYLKQMTPVIFEVLATTLEEAGGLRSHDGIEFTYVLSGTLILHFEGHPPKALGKGASALFNCNTPHAYVSKGRTTTRVLNIIATDPLAHVNATSDILKQRMSRSSDL